MREVLFLALLAFPVHALVLRCIFPGYYDPLWPHHSDFYIPVELAESAHGMMDFVRRPRPVGMAFLEGVGYLGVRGSIGVTLALTLFNCAATAAAVRRFLRDPPGLGFFLGYGVYVFLVFVQPHYYVFYSHDVLSQVSYAFLLMSAWMLFKYQAMPRISYLLAGGVLALLAFFSKETYGPSFLFLATVFAAGSYARGARAALAARPALILAAALLTAFLVNRINGSRFTGGADYAGSPYQIVLAPRAFLVEWLRYAGEALNPISGGVVVLVALALAIFAGGRSVRFVLAVALPVAGAAAWLGNATLPNHHFAGYSWNGAYLMYAPILCLAPLAVLGRIPSVCFIAVMVLALCAPALNKAAYAGNQWALEQEARQRNLLNAIVATRNLSPSSPRAKILVTGINFPFSPFDHGAALGWYPVLKDIRFDVMTYTRAAGSIISASSNVRFIPRAQIALADYDVVWAFRSNGTMAAVVEAPRREPESGSDPMGARNLWIFPNLFDLASADDGVKYLRCGSELIAYEAFEQAELCLLKAVRVSAMNPYPYFYLGTIREISGDIEGARPYFERAVALDSVSAPNPAFRAAVSRIDAVSRPHN